MRMIMTGAMLVSMLVLMGMIMIVCIAVCMVMGMRVSVGMFVSGGFGILETRRVSAFSRKEGQGLGESCIRLFNKPHAFTYVLRSLGIASLLQNMSHLGVTLEMIQVVIDPVG